MGFRVGWTRGFLLLSHDMPSIVLGYQEENLLLVGPTIFHN
jgi:hypothetical protein